MKYKNQLNLLIISLVITTISLLSTACSKKQEVAQKQEIRPVKTILVQSQGLNGIRNFPGRIEANKKVELAFRVSGKVNELLVKEGDSVAKGDTIAKLEATDFKLAVDDKKALFKRAEKDYSRGKKLVKQGHISRMDFDKLEAGFLSSQADFKLAKQQLMYTELKAPFKGTIAVRHIQNFEEVQAKQGVVTLNDNSVLEVKFDVPENLILGLRKMNVTESSEQSQAENKTPVFAIFQSHSDKEYPLSYKEVSTKANDTTQTFSVTYTMPSPDDVNILPGMTTTVKIDLSKNKKNMSNLIYLPVSAVVANVELKGTVWVVDEKTMEVNPVQVEVGTMNAQSIEITQGLEQNQRVVIAGVPFLYKGLKVTLMKATEQAKDNQQHSRPIMHKTEG